MKAMGGKPVNLAKVTIGSTAESVSINSLNSFSLGRSLISIENVLEA